MLKRERQLKIIEKVRDKRKVSSVFLAEELNVSEDTIRRDLNELAGKGLITKVHGGAVISIQKLYQYNEDIIFNREKKTRVAHKAVPLIKEGMIIIMSGGTTNLVLAKLFPKDIKATIYAYSLPIAMQLTEHPLIEIIFIGGQIQKKSMVTTGVDVIQFLSKIKANICFMGVSGLSIEHGITDEGYEVSLIKKAMISSSEKIVYIVTSDKLNIRHSFNVCNLKEIDTAITDLDPTDVELKEYIKAGVNLL
ncbi:MAG: DeoR/GlpR transcriptional regulator [Flavobacteriaceae bacterium]|nr:DeoR/GlpR transcriptional regulator [Flavobacteriaceae bacterium]